MSWQASTRSWQVVYLILDYSLTIKSLHLPQNNFIQPLWRINHFWLVVYRGWPNLSSPLMPIFVGITYSYMGREANSGVSF